MDFKSILLGHFDILLNGPPRSEAFSSGRSKVECEELMLTVAVHHDLDI